MKAAIMQPYIFPYIGYFQMINAVDVFVFYDDVQYIKGGWINRNNILINNNRNLFTIQLVDSSANKLINEIKVSAKNSKFLKSIELAYRKAPCFEAFFPVVEKVFDGNTELISEMAAKSVVGVCDYLGVTTKMVKSSESHSASIELRKEFRLFDICKKEGAESYINPIGGIELYKKEDFSAQGITLNFIKSNEIRYKQFNAEFVPWLSIIDVLMFNSKDEANVLLNSYELI